MVFTLKFSKKVTLENDYVKFNFNNNDNNKFDINCNEKKNSNLFDDINNIVDSLLKKIILIYDNKNKISAGKFL
jgi:hypothetical protein